MVYIHFSDLNDETKMAKLSDNDRRILLLTYFLLIYFFSYHLKLYW